MYKTALLIVYSVVFTLHGQLTYTPEDSLLYSQKMSSLRQLAPSDNQIIPIGRSFLGLPYKEKTLEVGTSETVVINLREMDCTTFVENVLAMNQILREKEQSFTAYANQIKQLRYRDGELSGYASRLHYFTDWIRNNIKKGFLRDITPELGGIVINKPINFMGTHRNLYPFLRVEENYQALIEIESELAKVSICIIPQENIAGIEPQLRDGDIIALATAIQGLDVTHTGFAIRMPSGRVHLLHASVAGEVTITRQPLTEYLKNIKNNTGIIIARSL